MYCQVPWSVQGSNVSSYLSQDAVKAILAVNHTQLDSRTLKLVALYCLLFHLTLSLTCSKSTFSQPIREQCTSDE